MKKISNILLTGSTGKIGLELKKALEKEFPSIISLQRNNDSAISDANQVVLGDLSQNLLLPPNIDLIIHLAAIIPGRGYSRDEMLSINLEGTKQLVRHAKKYNCPFLYFSSHIVKEVVNDHNLSIYKDSKLMAENHIKTSGINYTILRPCSVVNSTEDFHYIQNKLKKNFPVFFISKNKYIGYTNITDIINCVIPIIKNNDFRGNTYSIISTMSNEKKIIQEIRNKDYPKRKIIFLNRRFFSLLFKTYKIVKKDINGNANKAKTGIIDVKNNCIRMKDFKTFLNELK